jgi:hypothetical protein
MVVAEGRRGQGPGQHFGCKRNILIEDFNFKHSTNFKLLIQVYKN